MIGHPIMVLVLMTEPDFEEALRRLMKRCAYVVVPVSILLIKYYPAIGRNAGPWATASMNNGIASRQEPAGRGLYDSGLFSSSGNCCKHGTSEQSKSRRNELILIGAFLVMICWLLVQADSSTSTMTWLVGVLALLVLGRQFVNPRLIGSYMLAAVAIFFLADTMVGIWPMLLHALGRDSTLTGRTDIWRQVLDLHTNPLVGVGFESFWLGERLRKIGELYWWQANEAHNGYLETYLNLGLIGLFILVGWIVAAFRKSRLEFLGNFEFGRFRLSYFVAAGGNENQVAQFAGGNRNCQTQRDHLLWRADCMGTGSRAVLQEARRQLR